MADIQYTIGAKDNATPTLDKVGSTLSRLEHSTKNLGDNAETSFRRMAIGVDGLLKASGILFLVDKAIGSIGAAFSFVAGGVNDFNNAEAVANKLTEAMRANGEASQEMIDANIELSDVLEKRLNVEAESIQNLMSEAANLGVANDQLDNVTQAAIGLSEAMGVSLDDGLKKARLAADGNFAAFEKLIPSIKNMATDEEKLAAVLELSNKGLEQKESRAQSAAGAGERLATKIGDLAEVIGGALSPMIETATVAVEGIVNALVDILAPAMDSTGSAFTAFSEWVQEKMVAAANGVIAALTMAEIVVTNFGDVWSLVKDKIALRVETIRADVEQLLTVSLPAYGSWFAANFPRFFVDAFNAISTVIDNGATKVANSVQAIWDFIATRGEGGVSGLVDSVGAALSGSLLDGFESSIQALPQIAGRAITDTERMLTASITETADKLAAEYDAKMAQRTITIGGKIGEDMAAAIDLTLTKKEQEAAAKAKSPESILSQLVSGGASQLAALNASESRLLTRGPGGRMSIEAIFDEMLNIARKTYQATAAGSAAQALAASEAREAKEALQRKGSVMFARPPQ